VASSALRRLEQLRSSGVWQVEGLYAALVSPEQARELARARHDPIAGAQEAWALNRLGKGPEAVACGRAFLEVPEVLRGLFPIVSAIVEDAESLAGDRADNLQDAQVAEGRNLTLSAWLAHVQAWREALRV
jgi:hypothetical protein